MRVIGTAGHVDHGKSALVLAMTGINPDRLREEQERQMTIDLGFAWLTMPKGEAVGIVDVPGHRDFIENMLAGVGSIDAALFVIAADEGVMPQTREHLDILNLLQIDRGVVALSKVDLIEDGDWIDLVREDVRSLLRATALESAPIVPVSAHSGEGLEGLLDEIQAVLADAPDRRDIGQARLSIDRAFSIAGFGTVVTGTLVDGTLSAGDEIEILPTALKGRVRGLQTHKEKIETAVPGSRVAVNVSGVDVDEIRRGDVVIHPGGALNTSRIDVQFTLLETSEKPIKHNQEAKLFIGAAQRLARIRLLGTNELLPGQEGWLQLELDEPLVAARGDRYILRRPSPPATIGGGQVVDAHPERRHRRMDQTVIERLEHYLVGDPEDVLIQTLGRLGPADWKSVSEAAGMNRSELEQAMDLALTSGDLIKMGGSSESNAVYVDRKNWEKLSTRLISELDRFHEAKKLRPGMSAEELRSRLKLMPRVASALLEKAQQEGLIEFTNQAVRRAGFSAQLSASQEARAQLLIEKFKADPFSTPSVKESIEGVGEDVYHFLVAEGILVPVAEDVVFHRDGYKRMRSEITALIDVRGSVTIADVRDHLGTSRKYVLAFMEHLDAEGVTERDGDLRRLLPKDR